MTHIRWGHGCGIKCHFECRVNIVDHIMWLKLTALGCGCFERALEIAKWMERKKCCIQLQWNVLNKCAIKIRFFASILNKKFPWAVWECARPCAPFRFSAIWSTHLLLALYALHITKKNMCRRHWAANGVCRAQRKSIRSKWKSRSCFFFTWLSKGEILIE